MAGTSFILPRIPASFFGMVLGIGGLAADWRAAQRAWAAPTMIGEGLFALAALVWVAVLTLFVAKWLTQPAEARAEAEHPVQCCFIGLAGVATMLMAQGALPYSRPVAIILYAAGALFTLGFGLWRTGLLWHGERAEESATPVLYLPLVAGGFVTGNVAAQLGWADWGQLAFGAAGFSWLAIESVILHRLYSGQEIPLALRPVLGIQLAPAAVGVSAWLAVGPGTADALSHAMIGYALLQALLLGRMARWIGAAGFAPSWWAFSFGATALAGAVVRLAGEGGGPALAALAPIIFVAANLTIAVLAAGTIRLLIRGTLISNPAAASAANAS